MTDDISKLTKHELALELQEVLSRSKDNVLSWQTERETLTAKVLSLEEAVYKGGLDCASAAIRVKKAEENSVRMERISFEDRQALKNVEKLNVHAQDGLVAMGKKLNKERAKREKEELTRRELERQLKELTNVKQIQEGKAKPAEPYEDGAAATGDALNTTGDSPAAGKD